MEDPEVREMNRPNRLEAGLVGRPSGRARRLRRAAVVVVGLGLALTASACGSSASSAPTTTGSPISYLQPPPTQLQGCTYMFEGGVPAGESQGIQPHFPRFVPDQAAHQAIASIKAHGGTGLADGFYLPNGVALYAGPDSSQRPVATIPDGDSIEADAPVLWTTSSGQEWLAFFLACGGNNLYWVNVDEIGKVDPAMGASVKHSIAVDKTDPPSNISGKTSTMPIVINAVGNLAWAHQALPTTVGRGELVDI